MSNIDYKYVSEQIASLVQQIVEFEEIEKESMPATITLPVQTLNVLKHIASAESISLQKMIDKAATKGINLYMKDLQQTVNQGTSVAPQQQVAGPGQEQLAGLSNKMEEFQKTMSQFNSLASQLSQLEGMFKKGEDVEEK